MIRAAARGLIDFERADPFDPVWWQNLWLVLEELEAEGELELLKLRRQEALVYIQKLQPGTTDGHKVFDYADGCLKGIERLLFPWREQDNRQSAERTAEVLRSAWVAGYGDPQDPEVAEKIRRTVEFLNTPSPKKLTWPRTATNS